MLDCVCVLASLVHVLVMTQRIGVSGPIMRHSANFPHHFALQS